MRYVSLFCALVLVSNACGGKSAEVPSDPAGGDAGDAAKGGSGGGVGQAGGRGGASGGGKAGRGGTGGGAAGHGAGRVGAGGGTGGGLAGVGGAQHGAAGESGQGGAGENAVGGRGGSGGGSGMAGAGGKGPDPVKLADGVCPDAAVWSPGVEQCGEESFIHRIEALGCPLPARDPEDLPPEAGHDQDDDIELDADCYTDADCGVGGYCVRGYDAIDFDPIQYCITPCTSDADCGEMEACLCQPERRNVSTELAHFGACKRATCLKDADCGAGTFCRAPLTPGDCLGDPRVPTRLSCQTAEDECSGGDECPVSEYSDQLASCWSRDSGPLVCTFRSEC